MLCASPSSCAACARSSSKISIPNISTVRFVVVRDLDFETSFMVLLCGVPSTCALCESARCRSPLDICTGRGADDSFMCMVPCTFATMDVVATGAGGKSIKDERGVSVYSLSDEGSGETSCGTPRGLGLTIGRSRVGVDGFEDGAGSSKTCADLCTRRASLSSSVLRSGRYRACWGGRFASPDEDVLRIAPCLRTVAEPVEQYTDSLGCFKDVDLSSCMVFCLAGGSVGKARPEVAGAEDTGGGDGIPAYDLEMLDCGCLDNVLKGVKTGFRLGSGGNRYGAADASLLDDVGNGTGTGLSLLLWSCDEPAFCVLFAAIGVEFACTCGGLPLSACGWMR